MRHALATGSRRALLVCAGTTCLGLGVAGVFLPLLPTTPFVLLAAGCFARSSGRFHRALLQSPAFGPTIRAWQEDRSIPRRAKRQAYVLIPVVFAVSMATVEQPALRVLIAVTGAALLLFLHRRPSR